MIAAWPFQRISGPPGRKGDPFRPPALRQWRGELEGRVVVVHTFPAIGSAKHGCRDEVRLLVTPKELAPVVHDLAASVSINRVRKEE